MGQILLGLGGQPFNTAGEPDLTSTRAGQALVLLAAAGLLLTRLDGTGLWAPDEPRYAAVAEELRAASGVADRVLLHLNEEVYTQKPPLFFWLAAFAGAPDGRVSEFAARLPSALAGIALVGLTAFAGGRMFGARSGILGAAILLTSWDVAHLARRAQLDVLLTLFTTIALFEFWRSDRSQPVPRRGLAVFHCALGLAVLTKGPVGVLVPLLVIVAYRAFQGRLRDLRGLRALGAWFPAWGLALSLGPAIVWISLATALAPAGYFESAVVDNLWGRFAEGTSHERPFYYYLYQFPIHFLPWTPLWAAVVWAASQRVFQPGADDGRARAWCYALAWIGMTLLLFTASAGKRAIYLLPAFPAAALLCADATLLFLDECRKIPRPFVIGLAALLSLVILAGLTAPAVAPLYGVRVPWTLAGATSGIGLLGVLGWRRLKRVRNPRSHQLALVTLCVSGVLALELAMFTGYMPLLDSEKSARSVALAAASLSHPQEPVGLLDKRSLVGALNYYGRRRVAELSSPASIRSFVAGGGTVIVVAAKRLARVTAIAPVDVRARSRSGERELLVVQVRASVSANRPDPGRPIGARARPPRTERFPAQDSQARPKAQTTTNRS
ncbi:MAG: glycosyltransferase family 39 protein, partial [Myxococcota bacterium]